MELSYYSFQVSVYFLLTLIFGDNVKSLEIYLKKDKVQLFRTALYFDFDFTDLYSSELNSMGKSKMVVNVNKYRSR